METKLRRMWCSASVKSTRKLWKKISRKTKNQPLGSIMIDWNHRLSGEHTWDDSRFDPPSPPLWKVFTWGNTMDLNWWRNRCNRSAVRVATLGLFTIWSSTCGYSMRLGNRQKSGSFHISWTKMAKYRSCHVMWEAQCHKLYLSLPLFATLPLKSTPIEALIPFL